MSAVLGRRVGLTGNDAVALAWRQIDPDVVAAYPITPSTQIVERFSQYVADGEVQTQFLAVESEHSAISACVGASAAGARVMTATSSQGLALMHEILYVASGLRLPIIMVVGNRALSSPINIHGDHSDTMGSRDAGWIQLYCRDVQDAYDRTILAVRIAERARLPVMVCLDGFTLTHSLEPIEAYPDEEVQEFVGEGPADGYALLGGGEPISVGPLALPDSYMEFRRALAAAMERAREVIAVETEAFNTRFGRALPAFVEKFEMDDAEEAFLLMGSYADMVRDAVARWRRARRVGMVRLVTFRPFPAEEVARALGRIRHVHVLERADTLSTLGGPLGIEIRAALYDRVVRPAVTDVVFGLGGRELTDGEIDGLLRAPGAGDRLRYLGVRQEGGCR
ncbi:MAG: pyruvate ferredoxin oxidoreductase [Armatimonadota bacterium]|nr:pyruvate ferredoxin oxidoreductase [Armatimonadota bacterium]